jgi:hypothetical protein
MTSILHTTAEEHKLPNCVLTAQYAEFFDTPSKNFSAEEMP